MDTIKIPEPVIVEPVHDNKGTTTDKQAVASPTSTAEDDRKTQGQRHVNLIWETTQAVIAVIVTGAMVCLAWSGKTSELLASAFGMIVGMYFQRTNHTKIGGVGGTDTR